MAGTFSLARQARFMGSAWFAAALVLYWLSGARGPVWADPSKLTLYAVRAYFPTLNPGDHAGWTVLAWAWLHLVGGDPVVAVHRLSALCGALAVAFAALVVLSRTGDAARAHSAAALLLVSLPLWWAASVAETYAPALAATCGGALALGRAPNRWRWGFAGALWGFALAIHAMTVFLVVPMAWEVGRVKAWRILPSAVLTTAPVWLAAFGGPLDPFTGFAAGGVTTWRWHWTAFLAFRRLPGNAVVVVALLLYAFGLLGVLAFWRGRREPRASYVWVASLGALAVLLLTYSPYRLHLMVAFLVAGALLALPVRLPVWARAGHIVFQVVLYLAVPTALTFAGKQDLGVRVLPGRNNAFYFLSPVKSVRDGTAGARAKDTSVVGRASLRLAHLRRALDPGTDLYLDGFATCLPAGAHRLVLADFNPGAVMRLAQVARGWRPDLAIRPVAVDVALGARDPVKALACEVGREVAAGGAVLLADTYEPYYHLRELSTLFRLSPCGTAVEVERQPPVSQGK